MIEFQEQLKAIVAKARAVDVRAYERAGGDRVAAELRPTVSGLLAEARSLLASVLDACDGDGQGGEAAGGGGEDFGAGLDQALDAAVATKLGSRQAISEVAFIAQLELRQREERVGRAAQTTDGTALFSECGSSLRRINRALSAVDVAIAQAEGVEPVLCFASELQTSLQVRRAYAKLRSRILGDGDPTPQSLYQRLRLVGTELAMLIGRDVYLEMRGRDRILVRDLQERILTWMRGGEQASVTEGLQVWQDLSACVEMLALVNQRQELVEHDRGAIRDLVSRAHGPSAAGMDEATWELLRSLEGLDQEFDGLLAEGRPASLGAWQAVVDRLALQYVGAAGIA